MAQHLALSRLPSRAFAFLLSAFGAMAMALATVGLYGLVRYTVARRTREVGIRMALGADASSVARLLARGGVRLAILGGVIGIGASLAVARLLASLLFDVRPLDPLAFAGALLVFVTGAWFAAWLPARRAGRRDPLDALRAD
jgi:ABC-type antimicrobial peptide transport system permease subunit